MSQSIDRIMETIDRGLATAPTTEPAYGTDYHPDLCWRCQDEPPGEGASGVCDACRAILLDETVVPAVDPWFTPEVWTNVPLADALHPPEWATRQGSRAHAAYIDGLFGGHEPNEPPMYPCDGSPESGQWHTLSESQIFGGSIRFRPAGPNQSVAVTELVEEAWSRRFAMLADLADSIFANLARALGLDEPEPVPPVPFKRNARRYGR